MKRKTFLQTSAAVIGGSLLPSLSFADPSSSSGSKKKPIRFAHLTDIHVKPGIIPETGMAKALQHVQQLDPKVDFIINGGDFIMDALEADKAKTQTQWDLAKSILKKENSLPVYHTIGNHDVWGWVVKTDKPDNDRLYGKVWVVEMLEMKSRFYSFTKGNWHFIVLDSTQLNPAGGYIGKLDAEQMDWLHCSQSICSASNLPI